uniref:Uncharacterized protein n=1 Tax=Lepeophtheirus salmonis TaxID=72036 RepID=A0A0K2TMH6_LEPSM
MKTIFNLKGLAKRTFLCASAHDARRYASCISSVNMNISNFTHDSFLPQIQIQTWKRLTGYPRIQKWIGYIKNSTLYCSNIISGIAEYL